MRPSPGDQKRNGGESQQQSESGSLLKSPKNLLKFENCHELATLFSYSLNVSPRKYLLRIGESIEASARAPA
jgi:hypothetical protein